MANELIPVALKRLRDRLSNVVGAGAHLGCWLIEWPSMWASREGDKPGWSEKTVVWANVEPEWMESMLLGLVRGENLWDGYPFDSDGKLLANPIRHSLDDDLAEANRPFRMLHLSLPVSAKRTLRERDRRRRIFHDQLKPIFDDAGNLLIGIPANTLPVAISGTTDVALERWFHFLFDLAWAKIPGSPLRASQDKTHWYCDTAIDEYDPPRSIPDPEGGYSEIGDVVQASLHAIDILLTTVAENNGPPGADGKNKGKRRGGGKKEWKPTKATRHVIDLMKQGLSNDTIAERKDVKVKTSAENLRQIRARATHSGLLQPPERGQRDTT